MEDQKSDDRKNFMKPSYQDPLKKREDFAVSLRKKKTTEIINAKRRRMYGSKSHYPVEGGYPGADGTEIKNTGIYSGGSEYEKGEMYETFMNQVCPQYLVDRSLGLVDRIQLLLNALLCADLTEPQQLVLIINIRKTISGSEEPPVQEILATNILHMLGSILNAPDNNTAAVEQVRLMKLEAVWILSNLAYGTLEDIMKILSPEYGILTAVDHMMQTSDKPMLEQVLWFLGNVCGEDKKLQEIIISHTCIFAVLQSLIDTSRISRSLLRTICWVNSNIGRYRNLNSDQIRIVVAIAKAGLFCEDDSIASDSLWSIAYRPWLSKIYSICWCLSWPVRTPPTSSPPCVLWAISSPAAMRRWSRGVSSQM
ncbi:hypothetical protein FGO68_gene12213 [Halteria grandinella]|uniref:IBB domain-containing protein n=1 Tax=Halteria grandinella TaxID=5974 RepID=A0A8J8NGT7_HALGN|nr:hypothetical protein FGO68_gene12213 [Halteria grandinella]